MDRPTSSEGVVTPPHLVGSNGACACANCAEATLVGRAVCQLDADALEDLLESGTHSTNQPCHLLRDVRGIGRIQVTHTLEQFLNSHHSPGPEPDPKADAVLVLLLKYGADIREQARNRPEQVALVERLVKYALRETTNPHVLEHLLAAHADDLYPGGRAAMRAALARHRPVDFWYVSKKEALDTPATMVFVTLPPVRSHVNLRTRRNISGPTPHPSHSSLKGWRALGKAMALRQRTHQRYAPAMDVDPQRMMSVPPLAFVPTAPGSPEQPSTPQAFGPPLPFISAHGPPIHQPWVWQYTECVRLVSDDPSRVLRPLCSCAPGLFHKCRGSGWEVGVRVLVRQPMILVPLLYCSCGALFDNCSGEDDDADSTDSDDQSNWLPGEIRL